VEVITDGISSDVISSSSSRARSLPSWLAVVSAHMQLLVSAFRQINATWDVDSGEHRSSKAVDNDEIR
jgi:hypothetical protein